MSIKDLEKVNKFFGLRIELDDSNGYVLDQEVVAEGDRDGISKRSTKSNR